MLWICDDCNGAGDIKIDGTGFLGFFCKYETCYACRGDGKAKPPGWPYPKLMERMTPPPPTAPPFPALRFWVSDETDKAMDELEKVINDWNPPQTNSGVIDDSNRRTY